MKVISSILIFLLSFNLISQTTTYKSNINSKRMIATVKELSSKKYMGRLPGSKEYFMAANYMLKQYKNINLKPFGDSGTYFQYVPIEYNEIQKPAKLLITNSQNKTLKNCKLGKEYIFRGFTGSGKVKAEIVFCGYGISKPELGYDDYAGIDVKDKIVIVFKQNPKWEPKNGKFGALYTRYKANVAAERGAKAILFISLPNDEKPQPIIGSLMEGEGIQNIDLPQIHVTLSVADIIFKDVSMTLKQIQLIIDSTKQTLNIKTGVYADIEANAKYEKERLSVNVVGYMEGNDPVLKDEYVLVSSHLDHVGSQAGEVYFPGANDNASGSAAVLEMAQYIKENNIEHKRSIIFMLYTSEEQGLIGSDFFADHSPVNVDKIIAQINMDCIAYGDSIHIGNGKSAPILWNHIDSIDSQTSNLMIKDTWAGGGADANGMHKKGVPAAYFVTKNSYAHLHLPTDKVNTLNVKLYENLVNLATNTVIDITNSKYNREIVINK
ncbi:MAG: hypothetical protein A2X12_09060 [Bacteroidetes bacterium GWE2_29_8]|nr:MAG: hypothetical protein A2X12_09060 [Bacteroidetes bacterium GWE2_29_8]OFY17154.1 MAG: hypothetical protein A2X02_09335 [Bacteroidetes bacterium GWF2_29_10]